MQHHWLKREGNPRLLIFALGWASDFHAVEHLDLPGYDALCLYDYRTIESLESVEGVLEGGLTVGTEGNWAESKQIVENDQATGSNKSITEEDQAAGGNKSITEEDQAAGGNKSITEDYQAAGSNKSITEDYQAAGSNKSITEDYQAAGSNKSITEDYQAAGSNKSITEEDQAAGSNKSMTEDYQAAGGKQTPSSKRIYLIAWSFGVLASEYIFGSAKSGRLTPYRAIALNGTPRPIDDRYGIPSRSFALTLRSIPRMGIEEFNRRTFGDYYQHIAPHLEDRPFDEKLEELTELNSLAKKPLISTIKWDRAVIGAKDLIFAPHNMATYWNDNHVPIDWEEDMPHYPFSDSQFVITKLLQTL